MTSTIRMPRCKTLSLKLLQYQRYLEQHIQQSTHVFYGYEIIPTYQGLEIWSIDYP